MIDLAIRGGTVVDGTGAPRRAADVGIHGGAIVALGDVPAATREVDATGHIVAPGFVDIHSHSDLTLLADPRGESKVLQGVTTEVVGNCGLSVAPVSDRTVAELLRPLMTYCDDPRVAWDWTDVGSYLARVDAARPLIDVAILAGHNTIRASVLGLEARHATAEERDRMAEMLETAMRQGARGLSLGLMYPPSSYADHEEFVTLGRVLSRYGGVLASHMADYGSQLVESVEAMVRVGEESGCRIQISHLAVGPRENWGLVARALERVDAAVERGVDIGVDIYPYLAGSTNLSQTLPLWSLEGGFDRFRARVTDPAVRAQVLAHLEARTMGWDEILLVDVEARPELNGMRVDEAAQAAARPPATFVLELLEVCDPTIVAFGRSEGDLLDVLKHPLSLIGSDGLAVAIRGTVGGPVPHPRFFGTYPALLQKYVRESDALSLEDAIRKCTDAPARRFGLTDRGRIVEGARGDVVLIDLATVADRSSYADSRHAPDGIVAVFREGVQIAADGRLTLDRFPAA